MQVKTLLAVDDEPTNLQLIRMAVEESGLDVELVTATNGLEAIERARLVRPSLVLMDLKMPILDGWAATRRLKDDPTTATIPVIALSAQAMTGDRERALGAGCDGYVSKPLDIAAFVAMLKAHLA